MVLPGPGLAVDLVAERGPVALLAADRGSKTGNDDQNGCGVQPFALEKVAPPGQAVRVVWPDQFRALP